MNLTYLERVDPARNMLRFYAIRISPTLFGEWAVVREWGRIGSPGRERQSWFARDRSPRRDRSSVRGVDSRQVEGVRVEGTSPSSLLRLIAVTGTMHGADNLWILGIDLDLLSELQDLLIQAAAVGDMLQSPAFAENCRAVHHPVVVLEEQTQQLQLPQRKIELGIAALRAQLLREDSQVSHHEGLIGSPHG